MEHSGNGKEANVAGVEEESGEEGQDAGGGAGPGLEGVGRNSDLYLKSKTLSPSV